MRPMRGKRPPENERDGRVIVFVDAFSSGRTLAERFASKGFRLVHLASGLKPDTDRSLPTGLFAAEMEAEAVIEETARLVQMHKPYAIIPGCESGVSLADALNTHLGMPTANSGLSSDARRDKRAMMAQLRAHGIPAARDFVSADADAIARWADAQGYPIVVKPIAGSGGDAVSICKCAADIPKAIARVQKNRDKLSQSQRKLVLAQEYLDGEEFFINTISSKGHIFVSEFGRYQKIEQEDGSIIYEYGEFLPYSHARFSEILKYYQTVLTALGTSIGPTHGELKVTSRGVRLVEAAARIVGASAADLSEACYAVSTYDAICSSYVDPSGFYRLDGQPNELKHRGMVVSLINPTEHRLTRIPTERDFISLPSLS
jgi:biotin carboxylase